MTKGWWKFWRRNDQAVTQPVLQEVERRPGGHMRLASEVTPEVMMTTANQMMWARDVVRVAVGLIFKHREDGHECEVFCIPPELGHLLNQLNLDAARAVLLVLLKDLEYEAIEEED